MKRITIHIYNRSFLLLRNEFLYLTMLFVIAALSSCKPKFYEQPEPGVAGAGSISFNKYVAIGATVEAGYLDGALYTEGQDNAYPNLLAKKIKEVNTTLQWQQAYINSVNGWQFSQAGKNGRFFFALPTCTSNNLVRDTANGDAAIQPFSGNHSLTTNLSVPFIPITSINTATVPAGTKSTNPAPYFSRVVSSGTTKGIASEAKERNATFFTINLGYEDVLKVAKSGIVSTGLPTTSEFTQNVSDLLDSLLSVPSSKGVIATIPYVDQFPVITNNNRRLTSTSDPAKNPVRFKSQNYADSLNTLIGIPGLFSGASGNKNNFAIKTGAGAIRQLNTSKDFIVKGADLDVAGIGYKDPAATRTCKKDSSLRSGLGFNSAIPDADVLDSDEITALRSQIDAYNNVIKSLVAAKNGASVRVAIVDLNAFYKKLTDPLYGIQYGSSIIRTNHPALGPDFGGFFSLDRAYPTPKGQSLIANEFIKVINATWAASLNLYNPDNFRANVIPD